MRKGTRGYVLKVAIASATIGCSSHPVGTVASPPGAEVDAGAVDSNDSRAPVDSKAPADSGTPAQAFRPPNPAEVGTVANAPDGPVGTVASPPDTKDAGAPAKKNPPAKPPVHKVGTIAHPPDSTTISPTVGTTAHAPDSSPPKK